MALCSKCVRLGQWLHHFHNSRFVSMPTPCLWCLICIVVLVTVFLTLLTSMFSVVPLSSRLLCNAVTRAEPIINFSRIYPPISDICHPQSGLKSTAFLSPYAHTMASDTGNSSSELTVSYVTVPDDAVANKIAEHLVESGLAACVNIVPGIKSIYKWKGNIERDSELLLVIKSRRDRFPEMNSAVKSLHPYEVCEVISLPIVEGNPDYLKWLQNCVPRGPVQ